MEPVASDSAFEQVISEATSLLDILQREHSALMGRDPAAVEQIASEKQRQVIRLEEAGRQQSVSLRSAGYTEGTTKMESWIKQHQRGLLVSWQALQDLLSRCRQQNQINGGIIEASRRHTQVALGVLLGKPQETQTYSAGGSTTQGGYSRSLAKA